jgi:hypothetical protein
MPVKGSGGQTGAVCLVVLVLGCFAIGCGNHDLTIHVNFLSFLHAPAKHYGPIPTPPVPESTTVVIEEDAEAMLVTGLSNVTASPSADLRGQIVFANLTGTFTASVYLYVSGPHETPRSTPPLVSPTIQLSGRMNDTLNVTFSGSDSNMQRIAELITHDDVRLAVVVGLGISAAPPLPPPPPVEGDVSLTALTAMVTAQRPKL